MNKLMPAEAKISSRAMLALETLCTRIAQGEGNWVDQRAAADTESSDGQDAQRGDIGQHLRRHIQDTDKNEDIQRTAAHKHPGLAARI
jgi:hypothetical protein